MYENQTYELILQRTLDRVATAIDKREGSLIMNAVAPVSAEHANIYILLDSIIKNGYADTATRPYLIERCKERGIIPYVSTQAVLKGEFNMEIPIGSRFSLDELNYTAIEYIETVNGHTYYQLKCETAGTIGNKQFGELTPIEYIHKDLVGSLVEILIPAEDEEGTEDLRARYFNSLQSSAFGGNKQDYIEKTNSIAGVGGTVPIPVWAGGGTVKLIIIDSDFNRASDTLVAKVQNEADPKKDGTGSGFAPIGHKVTVDPATEVPINITTKIVFNEGYDWNKVKADAENAIKDYLLSMRKVWQNGGLVVRIAQIESRLLNLDGVQDISDTKINNGTDNIELSIEEIPVFGGVANG